MNVVMWERIQYKEIGIKRHHTLVTYAMMNSRNMNNRGDINLMDLLKESESNEMYKRLACDPLLEVIFKKDYIQVFSFTLVDAYASNGKKLADNDPRAVECNVIGALYQKIYEVTHAKMWARLCDHTAREHGPECKVCVVCSRYTAISHMGFNDGYIKDVHPASNEYCYYQAISTRCECLEEDRLNRGEQLMVVMQNGYFSRDTNGYFKSYRSNWIPRKAFVCYLCRSVLCKGNAAGVFISENHRGAKVYADVIFKKFVWDEFRHVRRVGGGGYGSLYKSSSAADSFVRGVDSLNASYRADVDLYSMPVRKGTLKYLCMIVLSSSDMQSARQMCYGIFG